MSLTITLELSPALESEIRQSMKQQNLEQARYLLADALLPSLEELMEEDIQASEADATWEVLADQLVDELSISLAVNALPLSDEAISRAGIYQEHP